MKFLRGVGLYLLAVSSVLLVSSLWQVTFRSGRADLSFLLLVPFAIGLLRARSWAVWGTGILGCVLLVVLFCIVLVHSISPPSVVAMRLGPITMIEPSAVRVWLFAIVCAIVLGLPMVSVLSKHREVSR
jgi:hypothetical protein